VTPPAEPGAVAVAGRGFTVDRAREAAFWDRLAAGRWEPATLAALVALTDAETLFLDIGAWIGPTALVAAAGGARVVALEPDPVARLWLGRNLALNPDLAGRVTVLDRALAPGAGTVRLATARGRGGNSMSSTLVAEGTAAWEVAAIDPAGLAALLPPARRLVVKMDAEGAEYAALPAMGPLLARAEALILAWHPGLALGARRGLARAAAWARAAAATRAGLAALGGFRFYALEEGGPRRRRALEGRAALGLPAAPLAGEWLFARGAFPA
jgi:FkbM family methyltransferase